MKKCYWCSELKPQSEFYKNCRKKDGLDHLCKLCRAHSSKSYNKKNREHVNEASRKYYEKNKDRVKVRHAEYRETNRAARREQSQEYYAKNKKKIRERSREYYILNKDAYRIRKMQRREKEKLLDTKYTLKDRDGTIRHFDGECIRCGSTERLEIDHHRPLSKGNGLCLGNAVLLCKPCNLLKGTKNPEDYYDIDTYTYIEDLLVLAAEDDPNNILNEVYDGKK